MAGDLQRCAAGLVAIGLAVGSFQSVERLSAQSRSAQAGRPPTGVVQGRVVAADTGRPIADAAMTLYAERQTGNLDAFEDRVLLQPGLGGGSQSTATDADGRFVLRAVAAGRYKLQVRKTGFVGTWYGQRSTDEPAHWIVIDEGQPAERIDLSLMRGAVIVASVTDDLGEPVANARVAAEQYRYTAEGRRLTAVTQRQTDDRGRVRLSGLQPGRYFVSATVTAAVLSGRDSGKRLVRTFYPAATDTADAQPVQVAAGQETTIAFSLAAAGAYRISGSITSSAGAPYTGRGALLRSGPELLGRGVVTTTDGTFDIRDVVPDRYVIDVNPSGGIPTAGRDPGPGNGSLPEYARVPIEIVAADVTNLLVRTSSGGTARGRLVFDDGLVPDDLKPGMVRVLTTPDLPEATSRTANVQANWTFTLSGLLGPRLFRALFDTNGWFLSSVVRSGRDITDTPIVCDATTAIDDLEIHVTRRPTILTGTVTGDRGASPGTFVVVVFDEDRERWGPGSRFVAAGRSDSKGQYRIAGLPPGRYLAVALDYLADGEEGDPDFLAALAPRAERITLDRASTKELTLKIVGRRQQ